MTAALAASLAFNIFVTDRRLVRPSVLLISLLAGSACCFIASAKPHSEQSAFWVFCLFEGAVGAYWPYTGYLEVRLIDDKTRTQVYAMLRISLNVSVVVSLLLVTRRTGTFKMVFSVCGTLLLASSGAIWLALSATDF